MHEDIENAETIFFEAKKSLRSIIEGVQSCCSHEKILEVKAYPYKALGGWSEGKRICICCGLEEHGHPFTGFKILTNEFRKDVSDEEFYKHRLPVHYYYGGKHGENTNTYKREQVK